MCVCVGRSVCVATEVALGCIYGVHGKRSFKDKCQCRHDEHTHTHTLEYDC